VFGGEPAVLLPGNPFVYPDNLPRVNAHGGPEGRPGGETTINP
jgi:ABC-type transporter Mla subunit MlaD